MHDLGQVAYDSYCESVGGVSKFTGERLPAYADQDPTIRLAWALAGVAVRKAVLESEPPNVADIFTTALRDAVVVGPDDYLVLTFNQAPVPDSADLGAIRETLRQAWPDVVGRIVVVAGAEATVMRVKHAPIIVPSPGGVRACGFYGAHPPHAVTRGGEFWHCQGRPGTPEDDDPSPQVTPASAYPRTPGPDRDKGDDVK